jgi:hypothetical protein
MKSMFFKVVTAGILIFLITGCSTPKVSVSKDVIITPTVTESSTPAASAVITEGEPESTSTSVATAAVATVSKTTTPAVSVISPTPELPFQPEISSKQYKVDFPDVAGNIPDLNIELNTTLPDLPDQLPVYQMVKPEITLESVAALGAKFGLNGKVTQGPENFLMLDQDSDANLMVFIPTGTIHYVMSSKMYPKNTPVFPSDEEVKKIAADFLVQRDLLPEGWVVDRVEVGGRSRGMISHLWVGFKQATNLIGPGPQHSVRIGDGGEVIDVFINPTNPAALPVLETLKAKSTGQAYQEMKTDMRYVIAPKGTKTVKIQSVELYYWLEPIDEGQDYIAPVFVFKGICQDAEGKELDNPFTGIVEALN